MNDISKKELDTSWCLVPAGVKNGKIYYVKYEVTGFTEKVRPWLNKRDWMAAKLKDIPSKGHFVIQPVIREEGHEHRES